MSDDYYDERNPDDDSEETGETYLGRFDLDEEGHFSADIFRSEMAQEDEELHLKIDDILDLMGLDVNEKDTLFDLITQSAPDVFSSFGFDANDKDARGGYTREEAIKFLDETGWWGIADVFYDEEFEEYYIDINYEEGAPT